MPNKNGGPSITVSVNGDTTFEYHMDAFSFYDTRCLNQHIDYPVYKSKGVRFQKCYHDDGNDLENYKTNLSKGKLYVNEDSTYNVKIHLKDAYDNDAVLSFKIKGKKPQKAISLINSSTHVTPRFTVYNNLVKIIFPQYEADSMATVYLRPVSKKIPLAYKKRNYSVFLWDLNKGLPDSVNFGTETIRFNFDTSIIPQNNITYFYKDLSVHFYKTSLFDTLFIAPELTSQHIIINSEKTPLKNGVNITLTNLDTSLLTKATQAYQINYNGYPSFVGGKRNVEKNSFTFYTKELGKFALIEDKTPPKIAYIRHNSNTIVLRVSDNLSGIGDVTATLNGKWVLMEYDKHVITAKLKEENNTFAGEFELSVSDNAGNISKFTKKL